MLRKNHYLTLGIARNESISGVRQAFREIVKRYHPDRIGSERLRFFQQIIDAYHVLADPERRARYDEELLSAEADWQQRFGSAANPDALPQARTVLRTMTIRDAPFEAALALVSGRLTGQDPAGDFCQPLAARVILSPEEAAQGGIVVLAVPSCAPCVRCRGSGRESLFPCAACDGEGLVEEQEIVRVPLPAMVPDGTVMNVPLRGLGIHNFYLRVQVRVATPASPRR